MGGMNVERVAGHRIDPAVGETLAGENQGMDAFVVDDGELYILFEWSFDWQSPHYQTLPTIHRVNRTRGCHSGTPIIQPAGFGLTGDQPASVGLVCGNRSDELWPSLDRRYSLRLARPRAARPLARCLSP